MCAQDVSALLFSAKLQSEPRWSCLEAGDLGQSPPFPRACVRRTRWFSFLPSCQIFSSLMRACNSQLPCTSELTGMYQGQRRSKALPASAPTSSILSDACTHRSLPRGRIPQTSFPPKQQEKDVILTHKGQTQDK